MYDFLTHNSLYVVLIIALMVFAGVGYLLMRLESTITALEQKNSTQSTSKE
jgi:hypothetical protein